MSSKYPVADKGVLRKLSLSKKRSSKSLITDKGVLQKTELEQKRSSKSLVPGKGVLQKLSWSKKKGRVRFSSVDPPPPPSSTPRPTQFIFVKSGPAACPHNLNWMIL